MPAHPIQTLVAAASKDVHPTPTQPQREAGNYRKGHFFAHGLNVTIEVAKGQVRKKVGKDGKVWSRTMAADYGYIRGTRGPDKDQVDVYIGPHPHSELVFVVDQLKADGSFDEPKAVLGTLNAAEAKELYLKHYPEGWKGLGAITGMFLPSFKKWVFSDRAKKPASGKVFTKTASVTWQPVLELFGRIFGGQRGENP